MTRRLRHGQRDERGVSMVEFALVLPILLLLVFGIIEFGRVYNAQVTLNHAAREAAREYALTQNSDAASAIATGAATSLDPSEMTVSVGQSCTGSSIGDPSSIQITYHFGSLLIPLYPGGDITLSAEGVMRCGG